MKIIKVFFCMMMVVLCSACSYERDETPGSLTTIPYSEALQMIKDKKTVNVMLTNDYCQHCQTMKEMLAEYLPKHHVDIYEVPLMENGQYLSMEEIQKTFPEFKGTPDLYIIVDGKIKAHTAGSMTADEFDGFVTDHKLDAK